MTTPLQHTPAPWVKAHITGGNYAILPATHAKHLTHTIASVHENHGENDLGNAALIAAAPDLLDAAHRALQWIKATQPEEHGNPTLGAVWGALEKAINKATRL